jgi:hypothetical protein
MSTVSPADEQQMRRWRVSPDRSLAWLGVTGLTCYGALWVVHQSFYNPFAVSVFMVGVGQAQMLTLAAVYALWLVPPFIYPAVLVRFLFSTGFPKSARVPVLEAAFGALLLSGIVFLFVRVASLRALGSGNNLSVLYVLTFFATSVGLLGFALLFKGITDLMSLKAYPFVGRPVIRWWRIRKHLGRTSTSKAVWSTYLPARRRARKQATARRAAWRRDFRRASRTYRLAFAASLGLGLFCAIFALSLDCGT